MALPVAAEVSDGGSVVNLESVIVGRGIPLFARAMLDLRLRLLDVKQVRQEIVRLHYHVQK